MRAPFLTAALAAAAPLVASAQDPARCAALHADAARLACYDALFGAAPAAADAPRASSMPTLPVRQDPSALAEVAPSPGARGLAAGDYLAHFWELDPGDGRDTFVVRTYQPNFLTAHISSNVNRTPHSPSHSQGGGFPGYRDAGAEVQVSLRAKVLRDFVGHGNLWLAYTQQSLWQVLDGDDSRPFRASDYRPEADYVLPIPERLGAFGGWRWRLAQVGIAHESNGLSDPLSRSWNYADLGTAVTHDDYALQARHFWRLPESGVNDNVDLASYIGSTELEIDWFPGASTHQLTVRTSFESWHRGSVKYAWTHPVFAAKPDGLRWYMQFFSGYGETLLDYNHRQNSVAIGFTLFQL
ncbi:MAG: phospholipase A [Burkholderiaceae bacterium]